MIIWFVSLVNFNISMLGSIRLSKIRKAVVFAAPWSPIAAITARGISGIQLATACARKRNSLELF